MQHPRRNAVITLVIIETKRGVGIDGVQAGILQRVGAHLVGEPEAAAFLLEIQDDAAALFVQPLGRKTQLVAAVTAARSEHIAGETGRVQAHGYGFGKIRLSDDHRGGAAANSIAEHHKARRQPALKRDLGFAGDLERVNVVAAEFHHRLGAHDNERRLDQRRRWRGEIGHQQRGQSLRDLGKLDRGGRAFVRLTVEFGAFIRIRVGDQRIDCGRINSICELQRDGPVGLNPERSRTPRRDDEAQYRGCAEMLERMQARLVETIDRQRDKELCAVRAENYRPTAAELRKSSLDQHAIRRTEHSAPRVSVPVLCFTHVT